MKRYWYLYALYAVEAVAFALIIVGAAVLWFMHDQVAVDPEDWHALINIVGLHVVLVAPVLVVFFYKRAFVRNLWIVYAWTYVLLFANENWHVLVVVVGHALLVTAVLIYTPAGKAYFRRSTSTSRAEQQAAKPQLGETQAQFVLRQRLSRDERHDSASIHTNYTEGVFVGFVLMVWGFVTELEMTASAGFVLFMGCFLLYRRHRKVQRIFFRRLQ